MTNGVTNEFIAVQQALAGLYSLEQELGRGGMGIVYLAHEVALRAARDLAQQRLTDAVTALETIRLDLLRMQPGVGTLDGLTRDLDAARSVVDELESLLEGQEEVERVLKGG